ncbi:MAG: hypothetical protein M3164_00755 [Actinomycetota bacterium]|nr:hypothetical protein [Actinomycetota bacterium]
MKKLVVGICVVAVLIAGGIAAFVASRSKPAGQERPAQATSADASKTSNQGSNLVLPGAGAVDPNDPEQVKRLKEVNQVIFEVTQEALKRPKDQRMTPEEISALVRARIQELSAQK